MCGVHYEHLNMQLKRPLTQSEILKCSLEANVDSTRVELQPRRPIFEKCSHLREKGGC
jgi:hypothetical protein